VFYLTCILLDRSATRSMPLVGVPLEQTEGIDLGSRCPGGAAMGGRRLCCEIPNCKIDALRPLESPTF
jgi:hypothetical protein